MRRTALAAAVVLLTTCTGPAPEFPGATPPTLPPASAGVRTVFFPHLFEVNVGQAAEPTLLLLRRPGYGLSLEEGGVAWMAARPQVRDSLGPGMLGPPTSPGEVSRLRMSFVGAPAASPTGVGPSPVRVYDNRASRGDGLLAVFDTAVYADVWPGVHLVLFGDERTLLYEFRVEAGADPERIGFAFEGGRASVTPTGELVVDGPEGHLLHTRPLAYQPAEGNDRYVEALWLVEDGVARLALGAWDPTRPLVIDPALLYSTYLGGTRGDYDPLVATDGAGRVFLTAEMDYAHGDVVVACFDFSPPSPGTLLWMRTFEQAYWDPVVAHRGGALYLGLNTAATDLPGDPVTLPLDAPEPDGESRPYRIYVARLDPADGSVEAAGLLGYAGGAPLWLTDLALDDGVSPEVYLAGAVFEGGEGYGTSGAFREEYGGGNTDGFVARLSGDLDALRYFTHVGGAGLDGIRGLAVRQGAAYAVGTTGSMDFPAAGPGPGAPDPSECPTEGWSSSCADAFLVVLDPDGTDATLATRLTPGPGLETATHVALDAAGRVLVPVHERPSGLLSLTVDGSPQSGQALPAGLMGGRLALSPDGRVHLVGGTDEGGLATPGAAQPDLAELQDGFLATFDGEGPPAYYTYLGGADEDGAWDVATDATGIFIVGQTGSDDFPRTTNPPPHPPYQEEHGGETDIFLVWLADAPVLTLQKVAPEDATVGEPFHYEIHVDNVGTQTSATSTLTDEVPPGLTIDFATGCAVAGNLVTCTVDPTAPGDAPWSTVIKVTPTAPGKVCNSAQLEVADSDAPLETEVCTCVAEEEPPQADVEVSKIGPSSVGVGESFEYEVSVRNVGDAAALGVEVSDELTSGSGLVELGDVMVQPSGVTDCRLEEGAPAVECDPFDLAGGSAVGLLIQAEAGTVAGEVRNEAMALFGDPPRGAVAIWSTEITGVAADLATSLTRRPAHGFNDYVADLVQVSSPTVDVSGATLTLRFRAVPGTMHWDWEDTRILVSNGAGTCTGAFWRGISGVVNCALDTGTEWHVIVRVPTTVEVVKAEAMGEAHVIDTDLTNQCATIPAGLPCTSPP